MAANELTPLLLRPGEAAELLGIGRSKVFELLASGEIESIKLGGCRCIPHEALVEFVARKRSESGDQPPGPWAVGR